MFEQELKDQEASQIKLHEGDLFYNYEVKNWNLTPRLYKILAISAIANLLVIAVIGQTNLLTRRGCDSPFVGRVCSVLDTVYIGTVLFGTEREYVDAEYDKIDLGEADITFVDVSGEQPPLTYPEGYFQIANPEQYAMMQQGMVPENGFPGAINGFPIPPASSGSGLINAPAVIPTPNPNAVTGNIPDSPFTVGGDPVPSSGARKRGRGGKPVVTDPKADASPDDEQTANANTNTETPKVDPTNPVNDAEINRRPFMDLGKFVNDLLAKKQINLDSPFVLNAKGKLTKEGRLDPKTFKFGAAASNDPKMIEVVKESIEAINESGYLQYLSQLSGRDLNLEIKQDDLNLSAVVQSEMESETRARTLTTIMQQLIAYKKEQKLKPDADQNDKDDLTLLEGAKVEQVGKRVVITFNVPKAIAQQMIQRKLQEQAAELKKESGTAIARPNDNTAKK